MGLFSFIKNAGAKVFGIGKTDEEEAAEAAGFLYYKTYKKHKMLDEIHISTAVRRKNIIKLHF